MDLILFLGGVTALVCGYELGAGVHPLGAGPESLFMAGLLVVTTSALLLGFLWGEDSDRDQEPALIVAGSLGAVAGGLLTTVHLLGSDGLRRVISAALMAVAGVGVRLAGQRLLARPFRAAPRWAPRPRAVRAVTRSGRPVLAAPAVYHASGDQ